MKSTRTKILIFLILFCFSLEFSHQVLAKGSAFDSCIKDLKTKIVVNKDSSLLVTEMITADFDDLPYKHGIFRILPTKTKTEQKTFKTPIQLISITDFNGKPYKIKTIKDWLARTITWKIGDKHVTVRGENYYKIVYKVGNAIRFQNKGFDEFYWNLVGTFWDIPIEHFSAKIIFPDEINFQNTTVDYYTGYHGSKSKDLATYRWINPNTLFFSSTNSLAPRQGMTVSVIFPRGIFTPYQLSLREKYGDYFYFFIPLIIFIFCFIAWEKYGKDPKIHRSIPPEFGVPEKITPMQMGMLLSLGQWKNKFITAALIDLAVRGFIVIQEITEKQGFFKSPDYLLIKTERSREKLAKPEKLLMEKIFEGVNSIKLSSLKNKFYKEVKDIQDSVYNNLVKNHWIAKKSRTFTNLFGNLGSGILIVTYFLFAYKKTNIFFAFSIFLSGIILIIFGMIMPRRTRRGADLVFRIKGFELYMKTAERYRQKFYEKENIYDKFLPYAIVFGIAGLWARKMKQIYGEKYLQNYHPVWFTRTDATNFNFDDFASHLNSVVSGITSNIFGSSGAGGTGGSGGGSGGGGGGGW